jgi:hypothetical protein
LSIPNKDVDPDGYDTYIHKYNPSEKNWYVMSANGLIKTDDTFIVDGRTYYKKGEGGTDKYSYITNNTIVSSDYVLVNTSNYDNSTNPSNKEWYEIYPGNRYVGMDWSSTIIGEEEYWQNITGDVYVPTEDETIKSGKNYYVLNSSNGSSEFSSQGTIYFDNNRIRNIKLDINGGSFTNNNISYNSYFDKTGILINCGSGTVSGNTIIYKQTVENDTDIFNAYLIRAKNITNNTISTNCKVKYIFYPGGDAYITGNILSIPNDYNKIVRTNDVDNFIQPLYRNIGDNKQRPIFPIGEPYYFGCKYFNITAQQTITWNGYAWLNDENQLFDYKLKQTIDGFIAGHYIDVKKDIGTTIDIETIEDSSRLSYKIVEVHAGEIVVLTGSGGNDGALYALIDENNNLLELGPSVDSTYVYENCPPTVYVPITVDCRIIINFRNETNTPAYNNMKHIPYKAEIYSLISWPVTYNLKDLYVETNEFAEADVQFATILNANTNYNLPSTITVKMNDIPLTLSTEYTYNQNTGKVTVNGFGGEGGVTGKIEIIATGVG